MSDSIVEVIVEKKGQPESRFELKHGIAHAGRSDDNEVVLPDMGVSRRHVRLRVEKDRVHAEDLGSGNGTYFRGTRIQQVELNDGAQLYIDPFTLSFRFLGDAVAPRRSSRGVARPARLVTRSGIKLDPSYPLKPEGTSLGRSNLRDIILHDAASSRLQAEILVKEDSWWIKDESSANGTWLNGERVTLNRLRTGDRIQIGGTELVFEEEGAPGAAAQPSAPAAAPARTLPPPTVSTTTTTTTPPPSAARPARPAPGALTGATVVFEPGPAPAPVTAQVNVPIAPVPVPVPVAAPPAPRPVAAPRPPTQRSSGLRGLLLLALVGFGLFCVLISGVLIWLALHPESFSELGLPGQEPPASVARVTSPEVAQALREGKAQLDQGKTIEALGHFYEARKKDPENVEAGRLVYLSGEILLFDSLEDALKARAAAPAPKR